MQRIRFTSSDLARVQLRSTLGPLAEGIFALGALCGVGNTEYARWRLEVRSLLSSLPPMRPSAGVSAPDDLLFLLERSGEPARRGRFGGSGAAARLAFDVWRTGVDPYWSGIRQQLESECDARGRITMAGGVERLLATLHPRIVWREPVLEIHDGPDREIELTGQGLLLCPSVFLPGRAGLVVEHERHSGMAALVFAVRSSRAADLWGDPEVAAKALNALVGQTRAAALRVLTAACTTGELADRLGISSAGASQHATVLRKSGLITTRRVRNSALHMVTPLGLALLSGQLRGQDPSEANPSRRTGSAVGGLVSR